MTRVVPLKRIAALRAERRRDGPDGVLTLDMVEGGTGRLLVDPWEAPSQPGEAGLADAISGDVLFGKLRPYLAKVVHLNRPAYASTELMCLRPEAEIDSRWFFYRMIAQPTVEWSVATSEGTKMPRTSWERLGEFRVQVPERVKQRSIADYLDTETARIDALIAKKEALDVLLSERERLSIEQRLVKAAAGSSTLRRLVRSMPQYGAAESGEEGDPRWPRYIRITDLRSDGSLRLDEGIKRLDPRIAEPFLLEDEDILFARSGATSGKAFRFRTAMGQSCFAGYLIRFQFDTSRVLPELIELWTQTAHYWGQIAESTVQATIQNVSADKYMSLEVPKIPIDVQVELVEGLRRERTRTVVLRRRLSRQVALLREHRQALITAAVTGDLEFPGVAL